MQKMSALQAKNAEKSSKTFALWQAVSQPARQPGSQSVRPASPLAHCQPAFQSAGPQPARQPVSWPALRPASGLPASQPAGRPASSQPRQPAASQPARRAAGQPAARQQPVSQQDQQALINLPRWFASCRRGGGECNSQGMDADFISFLHFCMGNPTFSAFSAFWGCLAGVGWWWGSVSSHLGSLPKCRKCRKCWFYKQKIQKSLERQLLCGSQTGS